MEVQVVNEQCGAMEAFSDQNNKPKSAPQDTQMTSSIVSLTSSLTSPVDSGVQMLDSESEITSLMSSSGIATDFESGITEDIKDFEASSSESSKGSDKINQYGTEHIPHQGSTGQEDLIDVFKVNHVRESENKPKLHVMTKSDIDNHNTHNFDPTVSSVLLISDKILKPKITSGLQTFNDKFTFELNVEPNETECDEILQLEPIVMKDDNIINKISSNSEDLMNVSLNSYELLDYTSQNIKQDNETDAMHVSMSEEVNESLNVSTIGELENTHPSADDQIVFRRQRRKKSKSDTPKKRVSFHEDILNSTKIDDIHINHGFVTHGSDISMSFFDRGFIRKHDVVKGRYSWAAEGDMPYYKKSDCERQVQSDIYVRPARFSSTSSSSNGSISSSAEEDPENQNSDVFIKEVTQKVPKSSCLKKKTHKKYIDTDIVQEETNLRKKKSETNLLDSNIFGSLKNIFSFSTAVPLAERGVPEGQEDVAFSTAADSSILKEKKQSDDHIAKVYNNYEVELAPVRKLGKLNLELSKANLKLTQQDGFYPSYPCNKNLPGNIILCDSNVYEHTGISYSFEYEEFQKTFEHQNKPKSSTIYQTLLNELNFFKRREKKALEKQKRDSGEACLYSSSVKDANSLAFQDDKTSSSSGSTRKYSTVTIDFSDNDTSWDFNETPSQTRHLSSPKRKVNKSNYYSPLLPGQEQLDDKTSMDSQHAPAKLLPLKASSSKTSLINRFLKNVTLKKMIDLKLQKQRTRHKSLVNLWVRPGKYNLESSGQLDIQIEREISAGKRKKDSVKDYSLHLTNKLKSDVFRNYSEQLLKVFPVHSAYTTNGENKPLLVVLSSATLYVVGFKNNSLFCNHFVLPYTELNTVLLGPNSHTVHISNYDFDMQCIITTGSTEITYALMSQLEVAMRKDPNKPQLLAVKQLTMQDMTNLRKAICKQTSVLKEEEYLYYSIVNIQDCNADSQETPLGPNKEGPLMFKTTDSDSRWETAYFILKAGILYMLSSPSHKLPMRVLPLINGACQGAQRVYNCTRPHTFQIHVGTVALHLAAPDEYVASEWLQALVHAASKTYSTKEKVLAQPCTILMTSEHILTVREAFSCALSSSIALKEHNPIKGTQTLSCAAIADITTFKIPCAEQSWCILEFACREVHESSGDWIVYFATNVELEKFISTLEMLWAYQNEGEYFPICTIPETDVLHRKCEDTYNFFRNTWVSLDMDFK